MELPFDEDDEEEDDRVIEDESWKAVPIEEALKDLPKGAYKAFAEKNITTMGEFAEFQTKHADFWQKDLPGVGPETANKIADAAEKFWASRQPAAV